MKLTTRRDRGLEQTNRLIPFRWLDGQTTILPPMQDGPAGLRPRVWWPTIHCEVGPGSLSLFKSVRRLPAV